MLLFEESHGRTQLALPDTFLVMHEGYTLRIGERFKQITNTLVLLQAFTFYGFQAHNPGLHLTASAFSDDSRIDSPAAPKSHPKTMLSSIINALLAGHSSTRSRSYLNVPELTLVRARSRLPLQGPYVNAHSFMNHDDDIGDLS